MNLKKKFLFYSLLLTPFSLFLIFPAFAAEIVNLPNPLGTTDIPSLLGRVIKGFLGITGSIALVMFVYGGITWLTSGGVPDKIKKGKDIFIWSVVGLIIIFNSYLLVDFVITGLKKGKTASTETVIKSACLTAAEKTRNNCALNCDILNTEDLNMRLICNSGCDTTYQENQKECDKNLPAQ